MNPNSLNIAKIIETLNRGLTLTSKIIPAYQKIKPILNNSSYLTNILNMINTTNKKEVKQEQIETKKVSNNLPTFFQ